MMDIKINVLIPGFTKPEIILIRFPINQSAYHVKIYSLTFEKTGFFSGVNCVISIELNID